MLIPSSPGDDLARGKPELDLIVGVTSFGTTYCDADRPGVYTKIASFAFWIEMVIGRDKKHSEVKSSVSLNTVLFAYTVRIAV